MIRQLDSINVFYSLLKGKLTLGSNTIIRQLDFINVFDSQLKGKLTLVTIQ